MSARSTGVYSSSCPLSLRPFVHHVPDAPPPAAPAPGSSLRPMLKLRDGYPTTRADLSLWLFAVEDGAGCLCSGIYDGTIAGAKQWVRPVYYVRLSAGSTLASAFVRGSIDLISRT